MHNVKLKVNLNKKIANLTNSILNNTNFAMQESAKNSCKSIYKNFKFNSVTNTQTEMQRILLHKCTTNIIQDVCVC